MKKLLFTLLLMFSINSYAVEFIKMDSPKECADLQYQLMLEDRQLTKKVPAWWQNYPFVSSPPITIIAPDGKQMITYTSYIRGNKIVNISCSRANESFWMAISTFEENRIQAEEYAMKENREKQRLKSLLSSKGL